MFMHGSLISDERLTVVAPFGQRRELERTWRGSQLKAVRAFLGEEHAMSSVAPGVAQENPAIIHQGDALS